MTATSDISADMIRPPVNRAMKILDRAFFNKRIPTSAAQILDLKQISRCRTELHHDLLKLDRMQAVRCVRDPQGKESKALLLKSAVKADGTKRPRK
jgi:tRNA (guanine37-N1)-methyltransferase